MGDKVITLLIHVRGMLVVDGPQVSYEGGVMATSRVLDNDRFHMYDLLEVLGGMECSKQSKVFFKLPQATPTNHIISELQCETNIREMFSMYGVGSEIHVYVDDPFDFGDDSGSEKERGVEEPDDSGSEKEGGVEERDDEGEVNSDESDPDYDGSGSEEDKTSEMDDSSDDDMDDDDMDEDGNERRNTKDGNSFCFGDVIMGL